MTYTIKEGLSQYFGLAYYNLVIVYRLRPALGNCNNYYYFDRMASKTKYINPYEIVGTHPVTDEPINLKWMRGASRYNNGATIYGRKYLCRNIFSGLKEILKKK